MVGFQSEDQDSAVVMQKQLKDLGLKTHTTIQVIFLGKKSEQDLKVQETERFIGTVVLGIPLHATL